MMPRNVAKSGMGRTLLSSVMIAVPIPMPNSATPIGQAHRQHGAERQDEDDDRERQAEHLGRRFLELGEDEPAELDPQAVDLRGVGVDLIA